MHIATAIDWTSIDWVFLDMDGTLLDLNFDNQFWQFYLPQVVAETQFSHLDKKVAISEATDFMYQKYQQVAGTLDWYSTAYWSEQLNLPIMEIKQQLKHLIQYRADALPFLNWLNQNQVKSALVTNAHPDNLALKHQITGILDQFNYSVVSHDLNFAKEDPLFWSALTQHIDFDPTRTLFIDDSESVLATAEQFGIKHIRCIQQPDSATAPRDDFNFEAINLFSELFSNSELE